MILVVVNRSKLALMIPTKSIWVITCVLDHTKDIRNIDSNQNQSSFIFITNLSHGLFLAGKRARR